MDAYLLNDLLACLLAYLLTYLRADALRTARAYCGSREMGLEPVGQATVCAPCIREHWLSCR